MIEIPKVTLNNLNQQLTNLTKRVNADQITNAGNSVISQTQALSTTKLGVNVNEIVGGWQGLTQEVDNQGDGVTSTSNKGLALLTDQPPGVTNLVTPLSSGAQNSLKAITGLDTEIGSGLNTIVHSLPTPEAVAESLSVVSNQPLDNLQSAIQAISPDNIKDTVAQYTINHLSKKLNGIPAGIAQEFNRVTNVINQSLNGFLDQGFGQIIKDLIQANVNPIGYAIGRLTRNAEPLPTALQKQVINLLDLKKFKEAAILMAPYSDLSQEVLEEELSKIDTSASALINKFNPETNAFGVSTAPIFSIGELDSLWKGADTVPTPISPFSSPVPDIPASVNQSSGYAFTFITSMEELEAELRSATREITETVIHWTANFIDQPYVGSEQIHEVHKQKGFSGIGYHYIIRRDGRIQRGRPINQEGVHAKDYGHNNYSIGISHVAGYNCVSGTFNPKRYLSSESISDPQWAAQKAFLEVFYRVFPAGQVLGHYQCSDLGSIDPGFDVDDYILNTFGKRNLVRFNNNFGPFSRSELASAISTLS
jgi:N-acetylmuramoyl-L-alanine amidase